MSEQEIVTEAASAPQRLLPGSILRQARETQGLTLVEAAAALKFSVRQIEALESDDFQQLQGKTFLRGFVRAYARLLKLEPGPLLDMLAEETLPAREQIVIPANMGETNPIPFYRRHVRKLLLAAASLLLAAAVWYVGARSGMESPPKPVEVAVPTSHAESEPLLAAVDSVLPDADLAQSATVVQPSPAVVVPELVFDFSDRSWLEVKDASGQILLTGEFPGGQKQTIVGKPPYQLWIGKVSAVKLNYAGRAIDLRPHAREDVARFTLEQPQ